MKVLFAPINIGSMPAITAKWMNELPEIEARYINIGPHRYVNENVHGIIINTFFERCKFKVHPLKSILYHLEYYVIVKIRLFFYLLKWIKWADVVHWTWKSELPFELDLKLAQWMKKKRFVEWVGSEIRNPDILGSINKYYEEVYNNGYEYKNVESRENSLKIQRSFAKHGFLPIVNPEMKLFVDPSIFKTVVNFPIRIEIAPPINEEKGDNSSINIVHSPTAKHCKGSYYIETAIKELSKKYPIDYIEITNVGREEVLARMQKCDLFIDQIIVGSYGGASVEAMLYGKPVAVFIMPQVYANGLDIDAPMINVNPDTIYEVLDKILSSKDKLKEIGEKSRAFAKRYHDPKSCSEKLISVYNS